MYFSRIIVAAGLLFLTAACKKEADVVTCSQPGKSPSYQEIANTVRSFIQRHEVPTQFFRIRPSDSTTVVTAKGITITIPANAFVSATGNSINSDTVQLEVREILTKSEMILSAMPTVSNDELLESGGEFYLKATQKGKRLRQNPNKFILLHVPAQPGVSNGMQLFYGDKTSGQLNWLPQSISDTRSFIQVDSISAQRYLRVILRNDSLGWINCDRYINSNPKTTIAVKVTGFNVAPSNTLTFIVFNNRNSVAQPKSTTDASVFKLNNAPINFSATAIAIREVDGNFYFGKETATIQADQQFLITPAPISEAELVTELTAL